MDQTVLTALIFFVLGLNVGGWVGRFSRPSLRNLGLTDAQTKRIEDALQEQAFGFLVPLLFINFLALPVMVVLWVNFPSAVVQIATLATWSALLAPFIIIGIRKHRRAMREAIEKVRKGSA